MKKLSIFFGILWGVAITIGIVFPNFYESLFDRVSFGAISYPTSLDSFSNPGATDSVATVVTHSTHHGNANDAIEALETKLGSRASTPVTNSVLVGIGGLGGASQWSTWATTTSIQTSTTTVTGLATLSGGFFSNASSTLQNFTGLNATTTNATTTSLAVSNLTSAIPYANASGSLGELAIGTGLTLSGGNLSASGGSTKFSTTSEQNLGTTTLDLSSMGSDATIIKFFFHASSTVPLNVNSATPCMYFNSYTGATDYTHYTIGNDAAGGGGILSAASDDVICLASTAIGTTPAGFVVSGEIHKIAGDWYYGTSYSMGETPKSNVSTFIWKSTAQMTSISFTTSHGTLQFATSTRIEVLAQ